jgi:hypothetical protein
MARVTAVQTNLTTGEITPRLHGRTDIDRYNNAARRLVNAHPVIHGGAKRRAGMRYYKAAKFSDKTARLIPFIYSRETAYMLEVGDGYVRVHGAGGLDLSVEEVSPYTEAQLDGIDFAHGADTMFLFHEAVFPQTLLRTAPTTFVLGNAAVLSYPVDETGTAPAATLTPSATGPVGETIYLIAGDVVGGTGVISNIGWGSGSAAYEATAHGLVAGQALAISATVPAGYNLTTVVSVVSDVNNFQVVMRDDPGAGSAAGRYTALSTPAVFSGDVGKVVRINGGVVQITNSVSSSVVQAVVKQELTSKVPAPSGAWTMHTPAWSVSAGYPRTGTLFEQRLVCAGSPTYPQTIWGSATAGYYDFLQGTNDDDAYSFTMASNQVNPISYLASLRNLAVHTYGGEFSVQGGVEKPITPTNIRVRGETTHGSKGVRPVYLGKESVFVQRSGRKVRALGYQSGEDQYAAPDLLVFAEHLTKSYGITGLAYQQEPEQMLWAPRGDGAFLSATIDRDQAVLGWAPHFTEGAVESMATIPNGDRDETWVLVRRTVNGATVRYLEIFDETFEPLLPGSAPTGYPPYDEPIVYGYTVDCGISFDNASGQTSFSVPHLVGCTVDIVADGSVMPQQVVPVSGTIEITRASYRTLIGLHFESEIGLLTPEIGTGTGSAQGNSMRTSEVTMRFLNTIGAKVLDADGEEQDVPFRQFGEGVVGQVPAPFTGSVRIETLGWERGRSEFTILQDQPLPMHLLSVVRKFQVND